MVFWALKWLGHKDARPAGQCGLQWAACDSSWNILAYDGSLPVLNTRLIFKPLMNQTCSPCLEK